MTMCSVTEGITGSNLTNEELTPSAILFRVNKELHYIIQFFIDMAHHFPFSRKSGWGTKSITHLLCLKRRRKNTLKPWNSDMKCHMVACPVVAHYFMRHGWYFVAWHSCDTSVVAVVTHEHSGQSTRIGSCKRFLLLDLPRSTKSPSSFQMITRWRGMKANKKHASIRKHGEPSHTLMNGLKSECLQDPVVLSSVPPLFICIPSPFFLLYLKQRKSMRQWNVTITGSTP